MAALPAFYYPSTIGWIDDNNLFLTTISNLFKKEHRIKTFNHASDCLAYFSAYTPTSNNTPTLRGCTEHEHFETINHTLVDFDVTTLNQIHDENSRSQEISVLIVDYHMPEMNGVELCKKLHDAPCKKILLTGEMEDQEAIKAFNEKVIDCFIRKDSKTLYDDISKHIQLLSQDYFRDRTQHLISHLEVSNTVPISDPIFAEFFQQFIRSREIKEYSVIDKNGSLFMLNKDNQSSCLVIHTDKSLDAFVDTYAGCQGTTDTVVAVKNRDKIPFFGIRTEPWDCDVADWEQHLHTPTLLDGHVRYYWCVVEKV